MNESVIPEALSPKRRLRVSDHTKLYDNRKSYSAVYYELSLTASLDPFALYDASVLCFGFALNTARFLALAQRRVIRAPYHWLILSPVTQA